MIIPHEAQWAEIGAVMLGCDNVHGQMASPNIKNPKRPNIVPYRHNQKSEKAIIFNGVIGRGRLTSGTF